MKITFFDIDGVLNDHSWIHMMRGEKIFYDKVEILNEILIRSNSKAVLISSWRNIINSGKMTIEGFQFLLGSHGFRGELIDTIPTKDPSLDHVTDRSRKIRKWLSDNNPEKYIILDDTAVRVPNLVRTNGSVGLNPYDIKRSLDILNG